MSERFEWVPDLARGEWLRPMEAEPFGSILSVVPRGFEAYTRIFHPVERDRPHETKTWLGPDETTYFDGCDDIESALEAELTTWAKTAASFDTTMHAEAQYSRLVRRDYGETDGVIAPDGWRYCGTSEGCLDAASLAAVAAVLARHTVTPDAGIAAISEGWGGVPARYTDEAPVPVSGRSFRERQAWATWRWMTMVRSVKATLPRRWPEPGSGLLARKVAAGPRVELHGGTGRSYALFEAGTNDFADPAWTTSAPWVDEAMWAQSPSILWPEDHSWVLATEIDFDSTLIAGTSALIRELELTRGVEVLPICTGADLSSDGDVLNRPQ